MSNIPRARLESVYSPTSRSRQVQNFHPSYLDNINYEVGFEVEQSQDTGLNLYSENPVGSGIIKTIVNGTIGTGLDLESSVLRDLLPKEVTDEMVKEFQKKVEAYWRVYSNTPSLCDFYGQRRMGELEAMGLAMSLYSGDHLRHLPMAKVGDMYLPKVQLISGRLVSSPEHSDTGKVVAGVERDRYGRDVAYYVERIVDSEPETVKWDRFECRSRNGRLAFKLIKLNEVEEGMVRGRSIFNCIKELMIQTGRYTEAEVTKAIIQACVTLFIESEKDNIEDDEDSGIAAIAESRVEDPTVTTPDEEEDEDTPITLSPGAAYKLPPGQKAHLAEATAPVAQFTLFMEELLKIIGMATDIPYEVLIKSLNASYSASQASIQQAARSWAIWRAEYGSKFLSDIYSQFIECLVRQGKVNAPGYLDGDPFVRLAWEMAVWHGPAVLHIDPVKAVTASKIAVAEGFSTGEIEARRLYNNNFDANVKRLGEEKKLKEENGLTGAPMQEQGTGSGKDNEEDNDDGEK